MFLLPYPPTPYPPPPELQPTPLPLNHTQAWITYRSFCTVFADLQPSRRGAPHAMPHPEEHLLLFVVHHYSFCHM